MGGAEEGEGQRMRRTGKEGQRRGQAANCLQPQPGFPVCPLTGGTRWGLSHSHKWARARPRVGAVFLLPSDH